MLVRQITNSNKYYFVYLRIASVLTLVVHTHDSNLGEGVDGWFGKLGGARVLQLVVASRRICDSDSF